MDYNQFKSLLNLKDIRNKDAVPMLEELIEKYPYFQTARILLAKSLHEQQSIHYEEALKIAAAYSSDRKTLQELINPVSTKVSTPQFAEAEISQPSIPKTKQEFTSPPPRIQEPIIPRFEKEEREWYSEDEISGKAFEEQDQKEKIVDPHKIIQQRLSEILAAPNQAKEEPVSPKTTEVAEQKEIVQAKSEEEPAETTNIKQPEIKSEQQPQVIYEEPSTSEDFGKTEPVQEESSAISTNRNEEIILEEAGKAHDILDRMEIEHALEESILASLEKLPMIAEEKTLPPIPSLKSEQIKLVPEIAEQKAEAEKPDSSKPKSFTEWMNTINVKTFNKFEEVHLSTKASNVSHKEEMADHDLDAHFDEEETQDSHDEEVSHDELIDKFIATEPKILPSKAEFYSPVTQAKKSLIEHEDLVTETLARIYTGQGHYAKAKWCYEKLSLQFPEKSSYFAALLKEVEQKEKEVK